MSKDRIYETVFGKYFYEAENDIYRPLASGDLSFIDEEINEINATSENIRKDDILRELGLGKTIFRTARAISAVNNPEEYLNKKAADLQRISVKLINEYNDKIPTYLKRYQDSELAREKLLKDMQFLKSKLMDDHHYNYPTQIKDDGIVTGMIQKKDTVDIK